MKSAFCFASLLFVLTLSAAEPLYVNEDAWHYWASKSSAAERQLYGIQPSRPEFDFSRQGLERYIDDLARGKLTHFVMNVNTQRSNWPSKSIEPVWASIDDPKCEQLDWYRRLKELYDRGIDPYKIWIDRCRMKGVKPWISIRMNDMHGIRQDNGCTISDFWRAHPEFHLSAEKRSFNNGLDFTRKQVRDRMSAYIRETLDRYDPDGIELDLIRRYNYLPIGRERDFAPLFTEYMRSLRRLVDAAAKRRGHPITVAVRLLTKPAHSRDLGMEADVWSKEGIVDVIIPSPYFGDLPQNIPLREWREWTGNKAEIVPCADYGLSEPGRAETLRPASWDELCQWAAAMHQQGARSLYFFNFHLHPQSGEVWQRLFSEGLESAPRSHP